MEKTALIPRKIQYRICCPNDFAHPAPKLSFLKQTTHNFYLMKDMQGEKQGENKNAVFGDCISSKE